MQPTYADQYRVLAERHWWWRARRDRILPVIARHTRPGGAILDVGCGGGVLFPYLDRIGETWGIEPDPMLLGEANPYRERIHVGQLDPSYAAPRRFNVVLFLDVLEHLDDPVAALRQCTGLMERTGTVIATVPAFNWLWSSHDDLNLHRTRFTRRTVAEVVASAGFRIEESAYFFHWTVPLMWLRKMFDRGARKRSAPPWLPPAGVNDALVWLSNKEFQWLSRFRLPFGSSILIVLRRID